MLSIRRLTNQRCASWTMRMLVAEEDRVEAAGLGQREARVLARARRADLRDPGMAERDDHIRARRAAGGNMGARRLDDAQRGRAAGEMAHVPAHDIGRDESD